MKRAAEAIAGTKSRLDEIFSGKPEMMLSQKDANYLVDITLKSDPQARHFIRFVTALTQTPVTRSSSALVEQSLALAKELGVNSSNEVPDFTKGHKVIWDGSTAKLGGYDGYSVLHEVCHWQVAPWSYRFKPDYGLGSAVAYDKDAEDIAASRDGYNRQLDEDFAVLMGSMWLKAWGFRANTDWLGDYFENRWDDCFRELVTIGLITESFEPRAVARLNEANS